MSRFLKSSVLAVAASLVASTAFAANIDLQSVGAVGTDGTAYFIQGGSLSGTGVFPAFVQIASPTGPPTNPETSSAYNTTANNILNNGNSDTFNHELLLSGVGVEFCQGTSGPLCYRFLLDINEENNAIDRYLSLDQIQIYTSATANSNTTNIASLGLLQYNLDATTNNTILLDYSLNPGSGKYDMKLLVPVSLFADAGAGDFVYLFSSFGSLGTGFVAGRNYSVSDGFEEWAVNFTPLSCTQFPERPECQPLGEVPEPATLALLGTGLAALAIALRRRAS